MSPEVSHHHDNEAIDGSNCSSGKKLNASGSFFDGMAPLIQGIGLTLNGVDETAYQSYVQVLDHLRNTVPNVYQTSKRACFTGIAILRNSRVNPHKDTTGFPDAWAAMCCFGDFEGGALCLPGLDVEGKGGIQIAYQPKDIIFLRSSLLEHYISPFEGERSELVFSTNGSC